MSDNLDRKEFCKMFYGDKLIAKIPWTWKKSFSMGVVIPHKLRNCNKCIENISCDGCVKLVNQNKEFSDNINEYKTVSTE